MRRPSNKSEQQELAEYEVERFRKNLGPFVIAAENTRMPMVFTNSKDPANPIIFANDSFLALIGYKRDEILGRSFNSLMEQGTSPETLAQVKAMFGEASNVDPQIQYHRKDGSDLWVSVFISPVHDEDGAIVEHFASFVDITSRETEQAKLKSLIDELNHRVKNTLSAVQSIVAQALRSSADPELIGEFIESRILALSRSHDLLTRESWQSVELFDVVTTALEPFGIADGRAERFVVSGENIRFSPNAAVALGIAFHELAINAVKYGAFKNEEGCVQVSWSVDRDRRLNLIWEETGGPPVVTPTRKGFGSQVIERGLAHELDGRVDLDYRQHGVVCTINIPIPRGIGDE